MKRESNKWYHSKLILTLFLFVVPPVGIYGIFKRKGTKLWKRLVYTFGGIVTSFILLTIIGYYLILHFNVNYQNGNSAFEKGNYKEALESYKLVEVGEEYYKEAQGKIKTINFKFDSIAEFEEKVELKEVEKRKKDYIKLQNFQYKWSDSLVKSWKGKYIKKTRLSKGLDTIYFQLSKNASKGKWISNSEIHKRIFIENYKSTLLKNIVAVTGVETKIMFEPNPEQNIINRNILERQKQIRKLFTGVDKMKSRKLIRYVKPSLYNPKSFEHIETSYDDKVNYLYVYMKYRAENSFGGLVINTVKAKITITGDILSVKQID